MFNANTNDGYYELGLVGRHVGSSRSPLTDRPCLQRVVELIRNALGDLPAPTTTEGDNFMESDAPKVASGPATPQQAPSTTPDAEVKEGAEVANLIDMEA